MLKRMIILYLVILTSITLAAPSGDGSVSSPYQLSLPEDIAWLSDIANLQEVATGKSFVLANDIDMQGVSFNPILVFVGDFDGQNHAISNLTPNVSIAGGFTNAALFSQITESNIRNLNIAGLTATIAGDPSFVVTGVLAREITDCHVTNVNVTNSEITINAPDATISFAMGGFVGIVEGSQITSCNADVDITVNCNISGDLTFANIGGFIGRSMGSSNISDCHISGTIDIVNNADGSTLNCGGFVALVQNVTESNNDNLVNCSSRNTINIENAKSKQMSLGGFAGIFYDAVVLDCYFDGSINIDNKSLGNPIKMQNNFMDFNTAGFASVVYSTTINNCESNGTINYSGIFAGGIGGFVGVTDSDSIITNSISAISSIDLSSVRGLGETLSGDNQYASIGGFVALASHGFYDKNEVGPSGELLIVSPIATAANTAGDLSIDYCIGGFAGLAGLYQDTKTPINITECRVESVRIESPAVSGGFIGCMMGVTDLLDDNINSVISNNNVGNASIKNCRQYAGGFVGYLKNSILTDCIVESISISEPRDTTTSNCVGGFVGFSLSSSVSQSHVSTTIDLTKATGENVASSYIGGFVGYSDGEAPNYLENFKECSANGFMQTGDNSIYLGGFIGYSDSCSIFTCFSTVGIISGNYSDSAGGFAGKLENNSNVYYCYSQGPVFVKDYSRRYGGFVGYIGTAMIREAVSSGPVKCVSDLPTIINVIEDTCSLISVTKKLTKTPESLSKFMENLGKAKEDAQLLVSDFENMDKGSKYEGGFIGEAGRDDLGLLKSDLENCYCDRDTTGQGFLNADEVNSGVKSLYNKELSLFDTTDISLNPIYWDINGDYPCLNWELEDIDGSSHYSPVVINNVRDFMMLLYDSDNWNQEFKITSDIELSNMVQSVIGTTEIPFTGSIDGCGHSISGYNYKGYDDNENQITVYGFFGVVDGATIENLGLIKPDMQFSLSSVNLDAASKGLALFANKVNNSTIKQCFVQSGSFTYNAVNSYETYDYNRYLGVFIGQLTGSTVEQCYATGSIDVISKYTTENDSPIVGGLIANATGSTIEDCYFGGQISEATNDSSEFCGMIAGSIENTNLSSSVSYANNIYTAVGASEGGTVVTVMPEEGTIDMNTFTSQGWDFYNEEASDFYGDWKMPTNGSPWPVLIWQSENSNEIGSYLGYSVFAKIAKYWGLESTHQDYNITFDFNNDGLIHIDDVIFFSEIWLD